jgi:HlyD family secretion protein
VSLRDQNTFHRPKAIWHPRMMLRRLLNSWPFFVWLAGIALVVVLFEHTGTVNSFNGVVETVEEPIAPLETARVLQINAREGQRVNAGDILAKMDTTLIDARIAIEQAEIAEAAGSLHDYQQRLLEFVRDFEDSVQDAAFDLENQAWNQRRDEAELAALHGIYEDFKVLRDQNLIGERELANIRPRIVALEQTVNAYSSIIALHSNRLVNAHEDRSEMQRMLLSSAGQESASDDIHESLLAAIIERSEATKAIFETINERRNLQLDNYILRAARDGIVSRVFHRPGDVVQAGDAVLRVVEEKPQRVIGFLPEVYLGEINAGDEMRIWEMSRASVSYPSTVLAIAPEVRALPGRVSPIRDQGVRGRNVIMQINGEHHLVPGQTVRITLESIPLSERVINLFR